jgi:DsbC/DsbD-like thiol-disulfide interchange protein
LHTFRDFALAGAACCALLVGTGPAALAQEPALASAWHPAESSRVRLVAGNTSGLDGVPRLLAGVEIEMAEGWKTYWRNPGTSGVPPRISWSSSRNLAQARLLFPAPSRFVDRDGDTIGYKHDVAFPVEIAPADAAKPIDLEISFEYGICSDICVPVELKLTLRVPPQPPRLPPQSRLARSFDRVPRALEHRRAGDPALVAARAELSGASPRVSLEAHFPGGTDGADVFAEASDGLWVPLPRRVGESPGGRVRFEIDLADGADVAELKGKMLRLTMVGSSGQSEQSFKLE